MVRKYFLAPTITAIIGLIFSFWVSFSLYLYEKKVASSEMQKDIDSIALSFSRELRVTTDLLYVMQHKIWSLEQINKSSFDHVVDKLAARLPYVDSIRWFSAVELDPQRRSSDPHYAFAYTYTTQDMIEPSLRGFNLYSLPFMQQEMQTSWYQGVAIGVESAQLQQTLFEDQGFFILFPIFFDEVDTKQERIKNISGFFLVLLDVVSMFESVLGNSVQEPMKLILQRSSNTQVKVLHTNVVGVSGELIKRMRYTSAPFFFGGKEWQVAAIPSSRYFTERMSYFPYLIMFLGSSIFMVVAYLLHVLQSRAINVQHRIKEKTRELREANAKLEKMSRCDSLTGLFNRAYFDENVDAEVKRAQRDNLPISLLLVEIDCFEQYSCHNGPNAGDNAIRIIGLMLQAVLKRPSDLLAKYAHDSFAILLPNTQNGTLIAEHCMQEVRKLAIPFTAGKENSFITLSIGGVTITEAEKIDGARLGSFGQIALNKAIAQGRDRIQWLFFPEETLD